MSVRELRRPAVAGLFYPGDPARLDAAVRGYLSAPAPREPAPAPSLRTLVVPHAGYVYSGPTAGVGYRLLPPLAGRVRRVLLLGPPHRVPVWGLEASAAQEWESPLGRVAVDDAERQRLVEADEAAGVAMVAVADTAHAPEHSLEVQVPFLQRTLPGMSLLPVLVGEGDPARLADLLEHWWADDALIVVSTDLSHYEPEASARRHDARTSAAVVACDPAGIGPRDACGAQALRTTLILAARHGARVSELDRRTSADTAGDPGRVVGYGAFAVEEA
jgi:AmmeMemoRadiSam system protein B